MLVVSKFTYTLETIIQAGKLLVAVDHVPVHTNPKTRESRLFPRRPPTCAVMLCRSSASTPNTSRCGCSGASPLAMGLVSLGVWVRFALAYAEGDGKGHVQSLILGAVLFMAAVVLWALGVIGDLLAAQRVMTPKTFERVRRIELELGVAPSTTNRAGGGGAPAARAGRARRSARRQTPPPRCRGRRSPDPGGGAGGPPGSACERRHRLKDGVVTGNTLTSTAPRTRSSGA